MSATDGGDTIESHGTALDKEKNRVQCKYCDKVVRGFNRLKHHLGGLGTDVVKCPQVPDDIQQNMKNDLLEKKKGRLLKEVGALYHPDLPLKRNLSPPPSESRRCEPKLNAVNIALHDGLASRASHETSNQNASGSHAEPSWRIPTERGENAKEPAIKDEHVNSYHGIPVSAKMEDVAVDDKEEKKDDKTLFASKCIGRFFFEAGIDLNKINLSSFQRMMDAAVSYGVGFKVPNCVGIKGWILEEDLREVQGRVEDIKRSWVQSGCSILLDCWTNQRGRTLFRFLVDCPRGTIFLRSVDASDIARDVDSLFSLISKVIEEVGVRNVVQLIIHDPTCYMEAVGKRIVEKYRMIFWVLCADHCINHILETIAQIEHVKEVLNVAKTITRFIHSHVLPLELMRKHIHAKELVPVSRLKYVASFITLRNMMSEKDNLMQMLNSDAWNASTWASKPKGITVSELIKNPAFWASVTDILKIADPLIGVLHRINGSDTAPMGFLYDSMDRAKLEIKRNVLGEKASYEPFWTIIDGIWNHDLHSQLHSAGYYLNPGLFYSEDFFIDAEVTNGLLYCIVRMIEEQQSQELVVLQLDAYKEAIGAFAMEMAIDQRSKVSPAAWWTLHGGENPELQKLAVKILSQTCSTAARYKLRRDLTEQLHAKGRDCIEQQKLADVEFVHSNLQLWESRQHEERDEGQNLMVDWITEV